MNEDMKKRVIENFYNVDKDPRPSYYQKEISKSMVKFGKDLGLSTIVDGEKNVVIFKPAQFSDNVTVPVILQAHMDLVFDVKPNDGMYNKETNPVIPELCQLKNEEPWNGMRGYGTKLEGGKYVIDKKYETSLGADDGIGVAIIMAILQDKKIEHPPIIAIFTTDEEVGMLGALKMDREFIYSAVNINTRMDWGNASFINVDEEQHGRFCYGCAGGTGVTLTLKYKDNNDFKCCDYKIYNISVSGLLGGHSGVEIHKRRANAHRLMGRMLSYIQTDYKIDFELFSIDGGKADNAIPYSSDAIVAIPNDSEEAFEKAIKEIEKCLKKEYKDIEKMDKMKIECKPSTSTSTLPMSKKDKDSIVSMLYLIPNDVLGFYEYKDYSVVETSSNLGVIETQDSCVTMKCAVRSFFDPRRNFVYSQIAALAKLFNFSIEEGNKYPGWAQKANSKLNVIFEDAFKRMFPKEKPPIGRIIHAGLENGAFAGVFEDIDMIACGPTIHDVHTINERLELDTVDKTVDLLLEVLKTLSNPPTDK